MSSLVGNCFDELILLFIRTLVSPMFLLTISVITCTFLPTVNILTSVASEVILGIGVVGTALRTEAGIVVGFTLQKDFLEFNPHLEDMEL